MSKRPIREVLAENLRHYMEKNELTQKALGDKAGMAQTTVSLYLNPERRKLSKSGKLAAPNLGEVEKLAEALEVDLWQLLRPMSNSERQAYQQIEAAFLALTAKPQTPGAPAPGQKELTAAAFQQMKKVKELPHSPATKQEVEAESDKGE